MKFKLGPVVHGVLLAVVLLFAYSSWTKEKKVASKVGTVTVWSQAKDSVVSLQSYNKNKRGVERTISIKRTDKGYIWGSDKRSRPKRRRPKKGADPTKPPEMVTTTSEFVGGEGSEKAFEHFANLKALHSMGKLTKEKEKEYGLEADNTVSIQFKGGAKSRTLIVGNVVFGSTNRYVLDTDGGEGYILSAQVIDPLLKGMAKLKLKKLHKFKDDDLSKVVLDTGKQKRTLLRSTVERNKRKIRTWTDESTPDTPDSTSNNFLNRINRLVPTKFDKEVKAEDLTPALVTVSYYDKKGKETGYFKLYKTKPEPEEEEDPDKKDDPTNKDDPAKKDDATKKGGATKTAPVKKGGATKTAPVKTKGAATKTAPVKKKGVGAGKKKTPGPKLIAKQPKPAAKKPPVKKPAVRKPAVKKPVVKKTAVKKPAAGKGKTDPKATPKAGDPKTVTPPPKPKKRKKPVVYYVMTERTHVFARVPTRAASRIEEDLKDLYDLGKSRTKRPGNKFAPGMKKAPKGFKVPPRPRGPRGRPGMRRPGRRGPHGMPPGMRRPGMRRPGMRRPPGRIPPGLPGSKHKSTLTPKKGTAPRPRIRTAPKKK